jgi:hypothetical protein
MASPLGTTAQGFELQMGTNHIVKRLPSNVLAFSVHPGVIATNLSRSLGVPGSVYRFVGKLFLKSIPQGAATTIYAATAPELASRNGIYLSDCAEKAPISTALDEDLAEKLWDLSEKAIGNVSWASIS